ncbi:MAG: asparagine--tRNA ligase [Spirochaetales bacterium]|nr:asparagine--tRNA ligase [Spirochaetales bacterium]
MNASRIHDILKLEPQEQGIRLNGWVRTKRESKSFCFVEVNDGSCMKNLQVIIDASVDGYTDFIGRLATGASVAIEGKLVPSQGKGQKSEVQASMVEVVGDCPGDDYPLQKKHHSFEFLRTIPHLRPRTNTFGAVTRVRNALSFAVHRFFQEQGFVLVHTPIITTSDCEGAGQMFQVTTLPLDEIPKTPEGGVDYSRDFFLKRTGLTVSGQLEGEAYACALGRIYTFGPTFRAEHSNTVRHLSEFYMIEPEAAFFDINDDMDLAEAFLKYVIRFVLDRCPEDMDFFNERIDKTVLSTLDTILSNRFVRMTYTEAIKELEKAKADFEFPVKWGIDLQAEHEKYLTEEVLRKPVILTDYPREIKAFYMKLNDDGKTVRAMDVLVGRLGEIIGGSERETNPDKLTARMAEAGLNEENYKWYLDLRRFGSAPHSGFGLGFERLLLYITGMKNIRDVIPFHRSYQEA